MLGLKVYGAYHDVVREGHIATPLTTAVLQVQSTEIVVSIQNVYEVLTPYE